MNANISMQKMVRCGAGFLVFAAAVLFLLLRGTDIGTVADALAETSLPYLIAGILMAEVFHLSEGINLRILLRSFGYPVTFWQGMKYAYIGFFFSSITPSSTGGQPAQLYAMKKDGIEIAHGTLALIAELTSFHGDHGCQGSSYGLDPSKRRTYGTCRTRIPSEHSVYCRSFVGHVLPQAERQAS